MAVRFVAVNDVVVLATSFTPLEKSLTELYCHFVTVPVCPLKVSVVELVPEQTVVPPEIDPPTEVGFTVIVVDAQDALY